MLLLPVLLAIYSITGPLGVHGARVHSLVVQSEKQQSFRPRTIASLASMAKLGTGSSFRMHSDQDVSTAKGVKIRPLIQTYAGYEVYGSVVSAELTMDGQFTGQMSGEVAMDLSNDIPDPEACQRNLDDIIKVALEAEGLSEDDPRVKDEEGRRIAFLREDDGKAVLAYKINFFVDEIIKRPFYIIDACDDTIYTTFNLIQNSTMYRNGIEKRHADLVKIEKRQNDDDDDECGDCTPSVPGIGGNQKVGRTTYNTPPLCLQVAESGSTCTMQTTYVKVVNNRGSTSRSISTPVSFTCSSGYTDPYGNRNGAYGVANDAMYFGHITGAFYVDRYNFRALSWTPKMVVHYGNSYENAFWTGRDMYFGDGGSTFYPFVCLDVTAHELAHGITSTNSNLEYRQQSGGINEAFSDISGEVIEHYTRGSNDWYVGYDIMKTRTALRYMNDPPQDGRSIKHTDDYYSSMDVHYSSGVFNHAFYRMVYIHGMDIYQAYKCFLDANRSRWGTNTGYNSGACHVLRACYANGYNTDHVRDAFTNVGISFSGCSLSLHEATLYSGQYRSDIIVSKTTNPIIEINLSKGASKIEAKAEDHSEITLSLATDEEAKNVVDEQPNALDIDPSQDEQVLFVKLKSPHRSEVKVVLEIIQD